MIRDESWFGSRGEDIRETWLVAEQVGNRVVRWQVHWPDDLKAGAVGS